MKLLCKAYDEKRCKSCSLIELDYKDGLNQKVSRLSSLFPSDRISPPLEVSELSQYRNKAKFVIGGTLERAIFGIPSIANNKKISSLLDCPLHHKKINKIACFIAKKVPAFKLIPYSMAEKKGEFKYLIINIARKTNEVSVRFGMRSLESYERVKKLTTLLQENFEQVKVVSFEVQPKHAAVFEGETRYLTNNRYINHDFEDFKLRSSTTNFFQVNSEMALMLYNEVFKRYQKEEINVGVDLFCGVGGFAFAISRFCKKVIGIEISENAIECAKSLEVSNVEFFCDDALKFPKYNQGPVDLLVVNPPRRGIGKKFSELICEIGPEFFVYSSCNPQTLHEDAKIFMDHYELERIVPVDMFALTDHLEVLSFWKKR